MNFALILFVLTVLTGVLWVLDKLVFAKQRRARAARLVADFDQRNAAALARKEPIVEQERRSIEDGAIRQPAWLEYTASFFPVILLVFVLRSFLFEPFRIPSGSMIPTLEIGDLILVNKYEYGIRLPVVNKKVVEIGQPKRGDVMVFRYPLNPSQDYIKRVVGLPGDRVEYVNKRLTINGQPVPMKKLDPYYEADRMQYFTQFVEELGRGRAPRHRGRPDSARIGRRIPEYPPGSLPVQRQRRGLPGPARALFHDGGQPGQQRGQPVLGVRAGRKYRRSSLLYLDEFWQYRTHRKL